MGSMNNQAFIDGQNLTLGTTLSDSPWKVLFPSRRKASSLYRQNISGTYYDYLDYPDIRKKIELAGWTLPTK